MESPSGKSERGLGQAGGLELLVEFSYVYFEDNLSDQPGANPAFRRHAMLLTAVSALPPSRRAFLLIHGAVESPDPILSSFVANCVKDVLVVLLPVPKS